MRRVVVFVRMVTALAGASFMLVGSAGIVAEPAPPVPEAVEIFEPSPLARAAATAIEARLSKDASTLADARTGDGLPAGWPSRLPLPVGARAVFTRSTDRSEGTAMSAWFTAPDTDLPAFFEKELPRRGWDIVVPMSATEEVSGEPARFYYAISPQWVAGVIVGHAGQAAQWYDGDYDFYVYVFPSTL